MDPIGLALENFDAIGAWRTQGARRRRSTRAGELADGTTVDGPRRAAQGAARPTPSSSCAT